MNLKAKLFKVDVTDLEKFLLDAADVGQRHL